MMKRLLFLILAVTLLIPNGLFAQKKSKSPSNSDGHHLVFDIANSQDSIIFLAIYYRDKLMLKDSVTTFKQLPQGRQFTFAGKETYQDGMYKLVSQKHYPYLDFIIDRNQHFSASLDTTGKVDDVSYVNSDENDELLRFQRRTISAQKELTEYKKKYDSFKSANNQDSMDFYSQKMKDLNENMEAFIWDLINKHPDYLFSKMQRAYKAIEVPDPPKDEQGNIIDSNFQLSYYMTHFWDNIDLSDGRMIFTPTFEPKIKEYFTKVLQYQEIDTINKYMDMVLEKAEKDSLMYRFIVEWLSYNYQTSKIIGHDAVFVHLVKNNHMKGKCKWIDEDLLKTFEKRAKRLEPLLIGKQSVELFIPDTSMTDDFSKWHSSYRLPKKYVILWFYDPDCSTCKKESKKLRAVYDSLERIGERNFDVYGIANDADIERWKKYVRENNFPWLNVGGNKGNVDYLEVYNIYESGNPQMFILNEKRQIILNKRIEMNAIPTFLKEYEKREALKNRKK